MYGAQVYDSYARGAHHAADCQTSWSNEMQLRQAARLHGLCRLREPELSSPSHPVARQKYPSSCLIAPGARAVVLAAGGPLRPPASAPPPSFAPPLSAPVAGFSARIWVWHLFVYISCRSPLRAQTFSSCRLLRCVLVRQARLTLRSFSRFPSVDRLQASPDS